MNKIIIVFLGFLLIFGVALAQADNPEESGSGDDPQNKNIIITDETPEQRLARMLSAFDEDIASGLITVSFDESISKNRAVFILNSFDLKIYKTQICGPSIGNPDDSIVDSSDSKCSLVDSWDESLKFGTVVVPRGEEKASANKLIKHDEILWIEPVYKTVGAMDVLQDELYNKLKAKLGMNSVDQNNDEKDNSEKENGESETSEPASQSLLIVLIAVFVIAVLVLLSKAKKTH